MPLKGSLSVSLFARGGSHTQVSSGTASQAGVGAAVVSGGRSWRSSQSVAPVQIGVSNGGEGAPQPGAVRREPLLGGLQDVFGRRRIVGREDLSRLSPSIESFFI